HIAHNCKIKKQTVIAGGALIGGSTTIGENCIIAGDVSISNNIEITNGCIVMAKSGVTKSLLKQSVVSGYPAQNHTKEIRFQAFLKRLFRKRN
ncbi:MAG: UDP-3-O-(3-hydroxymyristoyl)glucosamine N-acyltransferase, partial [Candidatus Margulisiibacteriota bacterium]